MADFMSYEEFKEQADKITNKIAVAWYYGVDLKTVNVSHIMLYVKEHEVKLISKFYDLAHKDHLHEDEIRALQYLFNLRSYDAHILRDSLSEEEMNALYIKFLRDRLSEILQSIRDEENEK